MDVDWGEEGNWGGEMLYCFLMAMLELSKTGGEGKHRGTCLFPERFFLHTQLDTKDLKFCCAK